jgi:prophage regulatory protein
MDPMLRPAEVMARTGLSRTSLWRRARAGSFPAPIEIGPNAIGWPDSVISEWLENRPRRTYGAKAPYQSADQGGG